MRRLGYVPALDGLRGVAILLVIAAHANNLIPGGIAGVDVFFVLSGFLITEVLLRDPSLPGFYVRRARRLLPALWSLLLVFTLVSTVGFATGTLSHAHAVRVYEQVAAGAFYVTNIWFAYGRGHPYFLPHLWSLAEEEQFYLLWPLALLALLRFRVRPRVIVGLLVSLAVAVAVYRVTQVNSMDYKVLYSPLTRCDGLLLGCAAAVAWHHRLIVRRLTAPTILLGLVALPVLATKMQTAMVMGALLIPIVEIATVVAVLAVVNGSRFVARPLEFRPLVELGRVSYGLYLWHFPIFQVLGWHLGLPISLVVAFASYHLFEKRFLLHRGAPQAARPLSRPVAAAASA
jgi:peptidoglycan/LPS O-acetylase OafA/YrhL